MKNIIVDSRILEEEKDSLTTLGYNVLSCPLCTALYPAVCGHPDMLLHIIDKNTVIIHKDMPQYFIDTLDKLNINVILSYSSLKPTYPFDIILNAVNINNYFIHYIDYTDKNLLNRVIKRKKLIKVKQGYTKCSTAIVSNNAIMTSDTKIASALSYKNFDVLLLPPGDITLPGLNYGFIGGCCGLIDKNIMAFFGHLEYYSYGKEVLKFLKKHKVEPFFLRKGKLIDRGSILTIL